jgi:histidinol-phosphate aminotransferase
MIKKLSENFFDIEPYIAGTQPKDKAILKLNSNENPYPPCPKIQVALAGIQGESLALYPSSKSDELTKALASRFRVKSENIFVANGSDEALALAFRAFFNKGDILFPDITYSFYPVWANLFNCPYKTLPLGKDFVIDPNSYSQPNGGIVLSNPNAPTGIFLGLDGIRTILEANKTSVVIVDEAYIDFGGKSAVGLINEYENLLIVQTFSKSRSLAGARIGVCFGSPLLINMLETIKNSFNSYPLDTICQKIGAVSVMDERYFQEITKKIIITREAFVKDLERLGFSTLNSKANFVFTTHENKSALDIYDALLEKNILVRHFNKPRIDNHLRISIGTDEAMSNVVSALEEILA